MKYIPVLIAPWVLLGCIVHEVVEERIPARTPVNVEDVAGACRQGADQHVLIAEVRAKGVTRTPSADDIVSLKQAGAGDELVRALIEAPVVEPRAAVVRRSVYYDPSPAVTVGALATWAIFGHHHHHGHWHRRCRWR